MSCLRFLIISDQQPLVSELKERLPYFEVFVALSFNEGRVLARRLQPDCIVAGLRSKKTQARLEKTLGTDPCTQGLPLFSVPLGNCRDERSTIDTLCRDISIWAEEYRARLEESSVFIEHNGISADLRRHRVTMDGQELYLSKTEFSLLTCFLRHPGEVLSKRRLSQAIYPDGRFVREDRLYTHIAHLRQKLNEDLIENLWGVGFRFRESRSGCLPSNASLVVHS